MANRYVINLARISVTNTAFVSSAIQRSIYLQLIIKLKLLSPLKQNEYWYRNEFGKNYQRYFGNDEIFYSHKILQYLFHFLRAVSQSVSLWALIMCWLVVGDSTRNVLYACSRAEFTRCLQPACNFLLQGKGKIYSHLNAQTQSTLQLQCVLFMSANPAQSARFLHWP